jgi:hypothetical protein
MKTRNGFFEKLIIHLNRKKWWHVIPLDPNAYAKRGKFFASSFREAEFWGRPLNESQRVTIANPLIGDEDTIEKMLFGRRMSSEEIALEERLKLDAKIKRAAMAKGYDSIVLMASKAYFEFQSTGKLPRRIELNVLSAARVITRAKIQESQGEKIAGSHPRR